MLARPEFAEAQPSAFDRILGYVLDRVFAVLFRLFLDDGGGISVVRVVVFAIVLLAVGYLVWRFLRGVGREASRGDELSRGLGRPPTDWAAEAEEHERASRHREAVRCRYRLLLARLAERGVVEEVAGRTSGEYLREARAAIPSASADLTTVTDIFERAWYADEAVTAEDVALVRQAGQRAAGAPLASADEGDGPTLARTGVEAPG